MSLLRRVVIDHDTRVNATQSSRSFLPAFLQSIRRCIGCWSVSPSCPRRGCHRVCAQPVRQVDQRTFATRLRSMCCWLSDLYRTALALRWTGGLLENNFEVRRWLVRVRRKQRKKEKENYHIRSVEIFSHFWSWSQRNASLPTTTIYLSHTVHVFFHGMLHYVRPFGFNGPFQWHIVRLKWISYSHFCVVSTEFRSSAKRALTP